MEEEESYVVRRYSKRGWGQTLGPTAESSRSPHLLYGKRPNVYYIWLV